MFFFLFVVGLFLPNLGHLLSMLELFPSILECLGKIIDKIGFFCPCITAYSALAEAFAHSRASVHSRISLPKMRLSTLSAHAEASSTKFNVFFSIV